MHQRPVLLCAASSVAPFELDTPIPTRKQWYRCTSLSAGFACVSHSQNKSAFIEQSTHKKKRRKCPTFQDAPAVCASFFESHACVARNSDLRLILETCIFHVVLLFIGEHTNRSLKGRVLLHSAFRFYGLRFLACSFLAITPLPEA
jgi:hypothetical protein